VNDRELGRRLAEGIEQKVVHARPTGDIDELIASSERRRRTDRRRMLVGGIVLVLVCSTVAYLSGAAHRSSSSRVVAPATSPRPGGTVTPGATPPPNADSTGDVTETFREAFAGSEAQREAAIQNGPVIAPLLLQAGAAIDAGQTFSGAILSVTDVSFADSSHAAAHIAFTSPDGRVLAAFTGYAVFETGRWQVAAETICALTQPLVASGACPTAAGTGSSPR
jgi:hypothetical protein